MQVTGSRRYTAMAGQSQAIGELTPIFILIWINAQKFAKIKVCLSDPVTGDIVFSLEMRPRLVRWVRGFGGQNVGDIVHTDAAPGSARRRYHGNVAQRFARDMR